MKDPSRDINESLAQVNEGQNSGTEALFPLLYRELRALAGSFFQHADPDHTLQPTAMVHEVFIKLTRSTDITWESQGHFMAVAARAMRQLLMNHARSKKTNKRSHDRQRVTLAGLAISSTVEKQVDLLDLNQALCKLETLSPRTAQIVEMRFLAGLEECDIAQVLNLSVSTIQREWRLARAFLNCELSGDSGS